MPCVEERSGFRQPRTDAKKRLQVQARGMLATAAKKIKIVRPGGNVMVIAPDLDRAKIDAHSLHAVYQNFTKNWQNFGVIAGS